MASFNDLKNRYVVHLNYPNHIQIRSFDNVLYPGPNEIRLYWGKDLLQDSNVEIAASFNGEEIQVSVIKTLLNQVVLSVNMPEENGMFELIVCGKCIDYESQNSTCKNIFSSQVVATQNPFPPQFIQNPTIISNVYTKSIFEDSGILSTANENINFYYGNSSDYQQPGVYYKSDDIGKIIFETNSLFANKIEGGSLSFTITSLNEEFYNYYLNYFSEDFINNKILNQTFVLNITNIENQYSFSAEPIFIDDDNGNAVFINLLTSTATISYAYRSTTSTATPWKIDNLFIKVINTATFNSFPSNLSINKVYNDGSSFKIGDYQIKQVNWAKHFYDERNISRQSTPPINYVGTLFNPDPILLANAWTKTYGGFSVTNNGGLYNSLTLDPNTELLTYPFAASSNKIYLFPLDCFQNKYFKISFDYWTLASGTLRFYLDNSTTTSTELIFEINVESNSGVSHWEYLLDSTAFHGLSFTEIKISWDGSSAISLSNLDIIEEFELGPTYWLNIPLTENIRGESYNLQYIWMGAGNQSLNQQGNINSNTGNPTYIFGEDNTILGDLWINDGYPTRGVQIHSDSGSSWIGSVGYQGRHVAQTLGIGGWLIWSGSVGNPYNPIDNPHYCGVGMELHAGMNSGALRFFTDPETNTGLLEITGSIYAQNGYYSGELQATSGKIAGLYITDGYIQNAPTQNASTVLFGSSSNFYNKTNFNDRVYGLFEFNTIEGNIDDLIPAQEWYGHVGGTLIHDADYYYSSYSGRLFVDLSHEDAQKDVYDQSEGYYRMFYGTSELFPLLDTYTDYDISTVPGDTFAIGIGYSYYNDSSLESQGEIKLVLKYFDVNNTIVKTEEIVLENPILSRIAGDFTNNIVDLTVIAPINATKLNFYFDFYRSAPVEEDLTCRYKLTYFNMFGNVSFLEISPDGLFYRASKNKYIKFGRGAFDIKGIESEFDRMNIIDHIQIGSGSYYSGQIYLNQKTPLSSSGYWQTYENFPGNINTTKNWINDSGVYNFNHGNKILDLFPQYPVYMFWDGNFDKRLLQLNSDGSIESPDNYGRYINSYYGLQTPKLIATSDLTLNSYLIDTIDPDPMLVANSDQAVPTQAAVKYYVGDQLASASILAGSGISGAGTIGYVPYWSATTTLADSILYYDSVNQRFGIGTTPTVEFEVSGTIKSTSLIAASISETSDERLKENIIDLESQLFNIYRLAPKRFNFISSVNKQEIGLIAQEVMKVYPELIIESGGYYSIEYSKLTTILISGMKDLIDMNSSLESRIKSLENKIEDLTKAINLIIDKQ